MTFEATETIKFGADATTPDDGRKSYLALVIECSDCGLNRFAVMFRDYEAGTEWISDGCCEPAFSASAV